MFTRGGHWFLSWAWCIQSTTSHPTSLGAIPRYTQAFWVVSSFMFPSQNTVCVSHVSHVCYMIHTSYLPWFDQNLNFNFYVLWILKFLCMEDWCPNFWSLWFPKNILIFGTCNLRPFLSKYMAHIYIWTFFTMFSVCKYLSFKYLLELCHDSDDDWQRLMLKIEITFHC